METLPATATPRTTAQEAVIRTKLVRLASTATLSAVLLMSLVLRTLTVIPPALSPAAMTHSRAFAPTRTRKPSAVLSLFSARPSSARTPLVHNPAIVREWQQLL
ncbi:hypothetical protein TOPH_04187 [Tolypocladium ophioglossoides CBS 100239]|uniref:Uncharacterized protein n=1 Tax=Tolypocladium ophioglossoides (strain CBS 100239) TaxID=1163406 RepID=A0A0L0NAS6_TOLOC|nr:hypothetical protein TOPH_04187 [Tolypocladium ophioglossoides CBS 100239]